MALKIKEVMCREGFEPDHYTYSALVSAFDKGDEGELVSSLFQDMVAMVESQPSRQDRRKFTAPFNAVMKYHAGAGTTGAGLHVFGTMAKLGVERNKITFTTLITSLVNNGDYESIIRIFKETPSHENTCLVANVAVAGSITRAAMELNDEETLMMVLDQFCTLHLVGKRDKRKLDEALGLFNSWQERVRKVLTRRLSKHANRGQTWSNRQRGLLYVSSFIANVTGLMAEAMRSSCCIGEEGVASKSTPLV